MRGTGLRLTIRSNILSDACALFEHDFRVTEQVLAPLLFLVSAGLFASPVLPAFLGALR